VDFETQGLAAAYGNDHFDPMAPWPRPVGGNARQARLNPIRGGGRCLKHPFYPRIVYPRLPDLTVNFLDDPIRRVRSVVTKTLAGAAVDHFKDPVDGTVITETWGVSAGNELTTLTRFFRQVLRFREDVLPPDQYLGWQPRDLSPKNFWIELLDVRLGQSEDYPVEALGEKRPYYMRQALSISFKLVREARGAAGVAWFEGL